MTTQPQILWEQIPANVRPRLIWSIWFVTWIGLLAGLIFLCAPGYSQNTQDLLRETAKLYSDSDTTGGGLVGGFSAWGLFGGLIFSGIGFVAFMYGKKNAEFRPMLLGLALMIYPYLLKGTAALYIAGTGLTAALYFWRE